MPRKKYPKTFYDTLCPRCGLTLSPYMFGANGNKTNGLQTICKMCKQVEDVQRRIDEKPKLNMQSMRRSFIHPIEVAAVAAVNKRIRSGEMKRCRCAVCGLARVLMHHEDYARPFDVLFLCHTHHSVWHNLHQPINGTPLDEQLLRGVFFDVNYQVLVANGTPRRQIKKELNAMYKLVNSSFDYALAACRSTVVSSSNQKELL